MAEKKTLDFPRWLEGTIVIGLTVMGVVECWHGQWVWGAIFGVVGVAFGIGLLVRIFMGGKDGGQ